MSAVGGTPAVPPDPAQAAELSLLVDLEAHWENLRKARPASVTSEAGSLARELQARQRAYDAFHAKLVAYNKRHQPAHVPELLLNSPSRLGAWCRRMADLYRQVELDPRAHCPAHLLEKAYWWGDRVGALLHKDPFSRPTPPERIAAVVERLEALAEWCEGLAGVGASS
jgi:hypothetical protein